MLPVPWTLFQWQCGWIFACCIPRSEDAKHCEVAVSSESRLDRSIFLGTAVVFQSGFSNFTLLPAVLDWIYTSTQCWQLHFPLLGCILCTMVLLHYPDSNWSQATFHL
jgi:hypothetical protein